jgi:hypothetical protein
VCIANLRESQHQQQQQQHSALAGLDSPRVPRDYGNQGFDSLSGRDDSPPFSLTGQTPHRRHESLDSTLSSAVYSKPVAKEKNNDDSDEEVAHAGSGLAAQRHSADPSSPEDETSDGDDNLLESLLNEQQNNKHQNQHPTTRR